MTEYDYSPDAYKRHLATQEKIARWVDETLEQSPCNPFEPLPPERFTNQTPQPAFYATSEGDISPSYYSNSRTHREEHSEWHHSSSQQSNTPGTPLMTPQAKPVYARSYTSPTSSAGQYLPYPLYPTATPSRIQVPATPSRIPSPYSSRHSSRHQPSPMPHRSSSQNSFRSVHSPRHSPHHSPHHIHTNPVIHQQYHDGGNTYPYFSPSHPQPMQQQHVVVVRGDRGFTVVPPPGHHVQVVVRFILTIMCSFRGDSSNA